VNLKNKKILFLVEGKKMEPAVIKSVAEQMFIDIARDSYTICSYGTSIYELYDELNKDSSLSLVGLLIEKGLLKLEHGELPKQSFSQIYLVFDFDPHYQKFKIEHIKNMLTYFNDETQEGKLYINYPMFEATYYLNDFEKPIPLLPIVRLEDCCGRKFKKLVKKITCFGNKNHIHLLFTDKKQVLYSIKWNYIRQKKITGASCKIDYFKILEKQIEQLRRNKSIYILSTFLLLIIDYNPNILDEIEKEIGLDKPVILS